MVSRMVSNEDVSKRLASGLISCCIRDAQVLEALCSCTIATNREENYLGSVFRKAN